jgi:uncharacterized small protein (DUF1192 family)
MFGEGDEVRKQTAHEIGQDLSLVSVDELRERLVLLNGEIARIEAEIERKGASRAEADQVFKI